MRYQRWAEKRFTWVLNVGYAGNAEAKRPIQKMLPSSKRQTIVVWRRIGTAEVK